MTPDMAEWFAERKIPCPEVEEFDKAKHLPLISSWYVARGLNPHLPTSYPNVGYVVDRMAAGFLMQTDTDLCMFELFVSDPKAPLGARIRAVTDCILMIVERARDLGFKRICIETNSTGIRKFANQLGMTIRKETTCLEGAL
jgi:hypothetical protein